MIITHVDGPPWVQEIRLFFAVNRSKVKVTKHRKEHIAALVSAGFVYFQIAIKNMSLLMYKYWM